MSYFDDHEDEIVYGKRFKSRDPFWEAHHPPQCNRCGSTDVRWRQQGGKWVLFSLTPGVEHHCPLNADAFGVVEEEKP